MTWLELMTKLVDEIIALKAGDRLENISNIVLCNNAVALTVNQWVKNIETHQIESLCEEDLETFFTTWRIMALKFLRHNLLWSSKLASTYKREGYVE